VTLTFGSHAEQVAAVPEATFHLPESLTDQQGAAFPLNYLTAYAALVARGRLKAGETVLVLGAAGGVGTAAVQVAKGLGARVIGVVSREERRATAEAAGANEVVVGRGQWRDAIAALGGADLVIDPVGGDAFAEALRCLRSQGRHVVVGFAAGAIPEVAVNRLLLRNTDVCGCSWSVLAENAGGLSSAADALGELVRCGAVAPLIGEVYPLVEGPRALRDLADGRVNGKAVLQVTP